MFDRDAGDMLDAARDRIEEQNDGRKKAYAKPEQVIDEIQEIGIWPVFEYRGKPTEFIGWKVSLSRDGKSHKMLTSFDDFSEALMCAGQYASGTQRRIVHHFTYEWCVKILAESEG